MKKAAEMMLELEKISEEFETLGKALDEEVVTVTSDARGGNILDSNALQSTMNQSWDAPKAEPSVPNFFKAMH